MTKYAIELEISGKWERLPGLYDSMTEAVLESVRFEDFKTRIIPVEVP